MPAMKERRWIIGTSLFHPVNLLGVRLAIGRWDALVDRLARGKGGIASALQTSYAVSCVLGHRKRGAALALGSQDQVGESINTIKPTRLSVIWAIPAGKF
jgi:hypothetical protein